MHRADLVLELKFLDDGAREIRGLATTPAVDRRGDIVEPLGVRCVNPLPLLWQHDTTKPVGTVTLGAPTRDGVPFVASLPRLTEPGALKDRVDEAWQSVKAGLVRFVSIGYRAAATAMHPLPGGGTRFSEADVCELSLVTVPANAGARILATTMVAHLETAPGLTPTPAGVSASPVVALPRAARSGPMTHAEQIQQYANARAPKVTRMQDLMNTAAAAGVTLDASQQEDYDALALEVKSLDSHITRLRDSEILLGQTAAPVVTKSAGGFGNTSTYPTISVRPNVPPGQSFVRAAMSLLAANGDHFRALEHAKQWKDSTPDVALYLKAAVAPGNTTDATWAGPLAVMTNVTNEFLELLRPETILGKIPGLRKVPFNVSVPAQTAGGVYAWVGQGAPKPVTKLGFAAVTLGINKAAGIILLTEELVRSSSPDAETIVRADMIAGIAAFLDQQFIDPAVAPVAGVSPGSITNGVTTSGASSNDPFRDLHTLAAAFTTANMPLSGLTVVMSETNALSMGLQRDIAGNMTFPGVGAKGGTVNGITILGSNAAGTNVVGLVGSQILMADDGGVTIDVSREASVQMDTAPMNPADATVVMTSLWQNNLVGLRAERYITWKRASANAVKYLTGAVYVPPTPTTAAALGNGGKGKGADA
jgi:HK97 family phage major capsid protein/HK97 family phage prohead protease